MDLFIRTSHAMQSINIARLDLASIRLVVLCAERGSLSAATKICHYTLSAGSQRLSALEDALGRRLFVRNHHGLQITHAGQVVVEHGRAIQRQIEAMRAELGGH